MNPEIHELLSEHEFSDVMIDIGNKSVEEYDHLIRFQQYWRDYYLNRNLIDLKYNPDNIIDWFTSNFSTPTYHVLHDNDSSLFSGLEYSPFVGTVIENIRNNKIEDTNILSFIGIINDIVPGKISYILFDGYIDREDKINNGIGPLKDVRNLYYLIEDEFQMIASNVSQIIVLHPPKIAKNNLTLQDGLSMVIYLKNEQLYLFKYGQTIYNGNIEHLFPIKSMKLVDSDSENQLALLDIDGNLHIMDVDYVSLYDYINIEYVENKIEISPIEREINVVFQDRNILDFYINIKDDGSDFQHNIFYITTDNKLYYNYKRSIKGIVKNKFDIIISNKKWKSINNNILTDTSNNFYYINLYKIFVQHLGKSISSSESTMVKFFKNYSFDLILSPTEKKIKIVKSIKSDYNITLYVLDIEGNMYIKQFNENDEYIPFTEQYEINYEVNYDDYSGMNIGQFFINNHSIKNGLIISSVKNIIEVPYEYYLLEFYKKNILYSRIENNLVAYIRYDKPFIYMANLKY